MLCEWVMFQMLHEIDLVEPKLYRIVLKEDGQAEFLMCCRRCWSYTANFVSKPNRLNIAFTFFETSR